MNDMSATIVAKSDQINAADLIGTSRTITVRDVKIKPGEDQPVSVYFEGDEKAFRPCKGVRRLLVQVWGADAKKYVGQSMTLFQDPTVTWAGKPEGGIRVSHMTGLSEPITVSMRTSRNATKPYVIKPLAAAQPAVDKAAAWAAEQAVAAAVCIDAASLDALVAKGAKAMGKLQSDRPELHAQVTAAYDAKRAAFATDDDDDPFADATTEEPARDVFGLEPLAETQDEEELPADADWQAKAQEFLGSIRNAKRVSYVDAVADNYREVCAQMPKALCDQVEQAMTAKRAELGEGK